LISFNRLLALTELLVRYLNPLPLGVWCIEFSGSRIKIRGRKISFGEMGIGFWDANDKKDKFMDRNG
jgi:hypothetical protein